MLPGGAAITWPDVFIRENGKPEQQRPSSPDALRRYFNLAHCTCAQQNQGSETLAYYELGLSSDIPINRPGEVFVGNGCEIEDTRDATCRRICAAGDAGCAARNVTDPSIGDVDTLFNSGRQIAVNTYDLINGRNVVDATGAPLACQQREGDAFIWVLVDGDGNTIFDYFSPRRVDLDVFPGDVTGIDTQPPPKPMDFRAVGADGAIVVSWDLGMDRDDDVFAYQALCLDPDTNQPVVSAAPGALYQTTADVCGVADPNIMLDETDVPDNGDPAIEAPAVFQALDRRFICGTQESGTATSLTISGLTNDKPYVIALLTIDRSGNVIGTYFNRPIRPVPAIDLWEDINDRDGGIEGGFCLLAETYGDSGPITDTLRSFRDHTLADSAFGRALIDAYYATLGKLGAQVHGSVVLRAVAAVVLAPLVALALAWHLLTLPGLLVLLALPWLWRRRRRYLRLHAVRTALAAAAALVVLAPAVASGDDFIPYWDEQAPDESMLAGEDDVRWRAGIRVGPYIPAIDDKIGVNSTTGLGPYEAMFGHYYTDSSNGRVWNRARVYQIVPMLDVDRVVWRGYGQLAVGASIGYLQKTAYGYQDGTTANERRRLRSTANRNAFRLIPFSLNATYRMTALDDDYGIPLVPYAKVGLAYYAWWINGTRGGIAAVCPDRSENFDDCGADRGAGASLGVVGSIGLSIRAERIDASAARTMRQSGIDHAGFYGELSFAHVDGFGDSSKLSVGAKTWFAGVDFEF